MSLKLARDLVLPIDTQRWERLHCDGQSHASSPDVPRRPWTVVTR